MNVFRIPFKWERVQPTLGQDLDVAYTGKLDAVVSYATGKGIWVLLDVHKYVTEMNKMRLLIYRIFLATPDLTANPLEVV